MDEQPGKTRESDSKADSKSNRDHWHYESESAWGFWVNHPAGVLSLTIGTLLMAPLLEFPGGNPKHLWWVAFGLWIICGALLYWGCSALISRLELPPNTPATIHATPTQKPPISRKNPGRSFEVIGSGFLRFMPGDVFTEYDLRNAIPPPTIHASQDPVLATNDFYEGIIDRHFELKNIRVKNG